MRGTQETARRRPSALLAGAVASGAGIYLFQVVSARVLDERSYAPVTILWTLQYVVFAVVLHPGETYVAREALSTGHGSRPARVAAGAVLVVTVVLAAGAGLMGVLLDDQLLNGERWLALTAAAVVLVYGCFVVVRGELLGQGRESAYAWVTTADAGLRTLLLLLLVGLGLGEGTANLAWTLPAGAAVVVVWYLLRPGGHGRRVHPAWGGRGSMGFLGLSAGAALAAQALLAGAPVLLAVSGAEPRAVATSFVVFTLARAPLVLGFGGLLAQVVPFVLSLQEVADQDAVRRALRRVVALTAILVVAAAVLGCVAGPLLVGLVFGADLAPGAAAAALVAAGSVLAATGLLLTQAAMTVGRTAVVLAPWSVALCGAAVLWTTLPGEDVLRVSTAFAGGEAVAVSALLALAARWKP